MSTKKNISPSYINSVFAEKNDISHDFFDNLTIRTDKDINQNEKIINFYQKKLIKSAVLVPIVFDEGCLSVPGFYEKVDRFNYIKYEATDIDGNKFVSEATELLAVCIQHEIDHLDGKLFVDYLSDMKRSKIQKGLIKQNNNNSDIQRKENPYIK